MFYTIFLLGLVIYKQYTLAQSPANSYLAPIANNNYNGQGPSKAFAPPKGPAGSNGFGSNPNSGFNNNEESSNEPAKYEFQYEVNDAEQGTMFGHSESRDGDLTQGEYNVVLPDGRKQIVTYTADGQGYHPEIRYEGEASNDAQGAYGGGNGQGQNSRQNKDNFNGYPSNQPAGGPY